MLKKYLKTAQPQKASTARGFVFCGFVPCCCSWGKQQTRCDEGGMDGAGTTVTKKLTQSFLQKLEEKDWQIPLS